MPRLLVSAGDCVKLAIIMCALRVELFRVALLCCDVGCHRARLVCELLFVLFSKVCALLFGCVCVICLLADVFGCYRISVCVCACLD